ncbi:unnamed protein product [Rotaria sordida]|uniref:Uncharacterized protein n=1 Tax=Rotaria sordida TaxID=392033 RepID=A0A819YR14_9BILA|nr:unnamed protein product [Rotaria sordida]
MDPKLMNILRAIADAYNNTDSSIGRRTILSIVAKQVDYNLISSVIPGLTRYRYTAARLYSEEYGKGMTKVPSHSTDVRYDPAQVEHFSDFVLSPHISIDLSFGEKTLRLSSGTELYVPDIIRSINSTRIIQQYYEYCHQMCSDFSPLDPQGGKGPSDRYAAVLKSHVRRYLNEGHDASTAAQFVAACASHGGVKNVHAFECQMTPTRSKTKVKINDITKLHNVIYESTAIRSYRAWNIGIGKMIMLDGNSRVSPNINSLVCINPSLESNRLINSSVGDRLNDTVSSVPKDADANDQEKSKPKLFFCDYEGCICRILNYGNLLHHIANGNHIERVEKLSMKDLAMITYKSKLDAAENQHLLLLELQRINFNRDDYNHIPTLNKGWALPLTRKVQTLSPKVKQFLKKKFDDGQLRGIRWQPQAVVDEMKHSKDPETGLYLFDLSELVKVSTVRSYFSRQKASNNKVNNPKPSTLEDNSLITGEQYDSEEDIEDEAFQEQLAIDLELQLGDIRSAANKDNMAEINLATATSKRALSSFENENLSHTRKSSRFPRKKGQ